MTFIFNVMSIFQIPYSILQMSISFTPITGVIRRIKEGHAKGERWEHMTVIKVLTLKLPGPYVGMGGSLTVTVA